MRIQHLNVFTRILVVLIAGLDVKALNLRVAVVVPGFLTSSKDFREMCTELTKAGIPAVTVPLKLWHWIPCLGGRSARPILERIDHTVQHLVANEGDITKIPPYEYTLFDCWEDFWTNPGGIFEVGGSSEVSGYPIIEPRGRFELPEQQNMGTKIALVGHSAGGWISRAYLSSREYGGKAYGGARFVHSLVTLGTPHLDAEGPAFSGIRWLEEDEDAIVPSLAVGGSGFGANEWGSFTKGSYRFCGFEDACGDGVTPIESSLGYRGALKLELIDVHHIDWATTFGGSIVSKELTEDRKSGKPWYGSEMVVKEWASFLKKNGLK